ncbi:MAG: hypothetical protein AB7O62_25485 [Pirellulales bacterium]
MAVSFFSKLFSAQARTQATYERGLAKAKDRKLEEALVDYNTVIETKNVSPELKAMALLNRGILFAAQSDFDRAQKDLEAVIKLPNAPSHVQAAAKEKLNRVNRRIP